ncbi:MAG: hypothetical protein P3W87_000600, partial [Gammaproteobacteria bacterium]|nr:hypothetical protein [Gammaproteobacteria bacterium]
MNPPLSLPKVLARMERQCRCHFLIEGARLGRQCWRNMDLQLDQQVARRLPWQPLARQAQALARLAAGWHFEQDCTVRG